MDRRKATIYAMTDQQFREFMIDQLRTGDEQFKQLHEALAANTAMTQKVAESTTEIVAAFAVTKRGVSFFSSVGYWLNKIARWATPIIAVAWAIWAISHGQWPKVGGD